MFVVPWLGLLPITTFVLFMRIWDRTPVTAWAQGKRKWTETILSWYDTCNFCSTSSASTDRVLSLISMEYSGKGVCGGTTQTICHMTLCSKQALGRQCCERECVVGLGHLASTACMDELVWRGGMGVGASMSAGEWNQPKIQPEPDQRDDKLFEDQVVGFLSLLHIRHTECWAQRALSTFQWMQRWL